MGERNRPITNRVHAQGELMMLQKAVEASGEVIFMTDRDGLITFVNPEFTRLYGYSGDEVLGRTTPRILKSGVLEHEDYQLFWQRLLDKQVVTGEWVNKCKDGKLVEIEGSANPILNERGYIIGFLAIQRDITERKRSEEALISAHEFQQSIIDGIADPIMVIGEDYKIRLMNQSAKKFSIRDKKDSTSLMCYQVSHQREEPCDGLEHPCPLQQVRESGSLVTVVHEHYQANGEKRLVEVAAAPMLGGEGKYHGIIEAMRDITERKRTEIALQEYTERLRALAAQLDEVSEAERQRLARELHDKVGQNLTALGINLNIVQSTIPEKIAEDVHFHLEDSLLLVEQTAERIRDVMADLRPPLLDDYGLESALRWYGEQFSRRMDIDVTVEVGELFRLEERAENALFRIAQEAMMNVAKHAQATQVIITLLANIETFHMTISDNGVGFDTGPISKLGGVKGWGLLTMSERAEAIGGRWSIESSPNKGTQVRVEVPR